MLVAMVFSERFRWAWLVCLLLLTGFLADSISSYWVSRDSVRHTITESSLPLTSDNVYSEIQRDLLRPVFISSLMAHDTFLRDWVIDGENNKNLITKYLHEINNRYSTISSFFISDKTLNYYHANGILKKMDKDEVGDAWYFRVKEMSKFLEINVDPDLANRDEMTIFINYQVFDYHHQFIGATGVGLTVNAVNKLISDYETRFFRQIYFTDDQGYIVLRPSNSPMMEYDSLYDIPGLKDSVSDLLSGKTVKLSYKRDGENRFLNCRYISELEWYLLVEQSEESMLAPLRKQFWTNILLAILITIIVAWICVGTINQNQKKLENRNKKLRRIVSENRDQKEDLEKAAVELATVNENLSDLNREKDEILSLVAHDLRNPLNGILGLCEIVETNMELIDRSEFIADVRISGERMNSLICNLLDASQIEAGHEALLKTDTSVNSIIEEVSRFYHRDAERKRITIEMDVDSTRDCIIQSHPEWLSACINNLLGNAVKYTPEIGHIIVSTRKTDQSFDIEIKDNGPGISNEDKARMFQKFQRLSAKPTGGESSTGLGLFLVKKMSERLGATIKVESKLGKGTSFIFSHPID